MAVHREGRGVAVGVHLTAPVAVGGGYGAHVRLVRANQRLVARILSGVGRTLTVPGGEI
jgi:hypothetical protein